MKVESRYRAAQAARRMFWITAIVLAVTALRTAIVERTVNVPEDAIALVRPHGAEVASVHHGPAHLEIQKDDDVKFYKVGEAGSVEIAAFVTERRLAGLNNRYHRLGIRAKGSIEEVGQLSRDIEGDFKRHLEDELTKRDPKPYALKAEERSEIIVARVNDAARGLKLKLTDIDVFEFLEEKDSHKEHVVLVMDPALVPPVTRQFPSAQAFVPKSVWHWVVVGVCSFAFIGGGGAAPWLWIWMAPLMLVSDDFTRRRTQRRPSALHPHSGGPDCIICCDTDPFGTWWFFNALPDVPHIGGGGGVEVGGVLDHCGACDAPAGCDLPDANLNCGIADCGPLDCTGCDPGGIDCDC